MSTLTIDMGAVTDPATFCEELRRRAAVMAPCPSNFTQDQLNHQRCVFTRGGRPVGEAQGRVVHVSPDRSHVAVVFEKSDAARLADLLEQAKTGRKGRSEPESEKERSTAKWKAYESLSKAEKIRLARYGSAIDRKLILRDRDNSLHTMILGNPNLKAQELVGLISSGYVNASFITKLCERREWTSKSSIALALVHCPKTPIQVAVQLVSRLQMPVIKKIVKEQKLRTQIITAARRRMR